MLRRSWRCVRDFGCIGFATVSRSMPGASTIPAGRPTHVVIIGDDMLEALGPAAFHRKSGAAVRGAVPDGGHRRLRGELPVLYTGPALAAMGMRWNGLIVETLPRWEASWADLIREANPSITLLIGTVKPVEGGVQ